MKQINNRLLIGCQLLLVLFLATVVVGWCIASYFYNQKQQVTITRSGLFFVPKECKNLGLLGSTPHPTAYVKKHKDTVLYQLVLGDFLDVNELKDSFEKTVQLCVDEQIDHLLIAYLPVYYVKLQEGLGTGTALALSDFLEAIGPQVRTLLLGVLVSKQSKLRVTLMLPSYNQLQRIPTVITSQEQYAQYLIKQFPKLEWANTALETITIINTKKANEDQQTDAIERYVNYEYLYSKPVAFTKAFLDKEYFHSYRE